MRPTQIRNEDKQRSGDRRGMNPWENLHIFNAELTGRGEEEKQLLCIPPPQASFTRMRKFHIVRKKQAPNLYSYVLRAYLGVDKVLPVLCCRKISTGKSREASLQKGRVPH